MGDAKDYMKIGREAGETIRKEAGEKFFAELQEYVANVQVSLNSLHRAVIVPYWRLNRASIGKFFAELEAYVANVQVSLTSLNGASIEPIEP